MVNRQKIKVVKRTGQHLETPPPQDDGKAVNHTRNSASVITSWVRAFRERQRENNSKSFKELFG